MSNDFDAKTWIREHQENGDFWCAYDELTEEQRQQVELHQYPGGWMNSPINREYIGFAGGWQRNVLRKQCEREIAGRKDEEDCGKDVEDE